MLLNYLQDHLHKIDVSGLTRKRVALEKYSHKPNLIRLNRSDLINFSSNDYLGLAYHPEINDALIEGIHHYGFGSAASAFITGYTEAQAELEESVARWLDVEKVVLFNSGYLANIGVLQAILSRHATVYADKLCHASLLDGLNLSQARYQRYHHTSISHLNQLCEAAKPDLIITESVFSMDGDVAPISQLMEIAKQYQAGLFIDDAHGIGVLGEQGRGVIDAFTLNSQDYTCLVMPLGKAFNAVGAAVAGSEEIMDAVLQLSRTCRYTTALPPALCLGLISVLRVIQAESWRRIQLISNINYFLLKANELGLPVMSQHITPIKPILIGDNAKSVQLQEKLISKGFYVQAIRPPTVPHGRSRLRICLNALHDKTEISDLLEAIGND